MRNFQVYLMANATEVPGPVLARLEEACHLWQETPTKSQTPFYPFVIWVETPADYPAFLWATS